MIKSAAIIKTAPRAGWREVRLAKKNAKKQAQIERKAIKVHFPSPMRAIETIVKIEDPINESAPTRDEMTTKARELGIKFDGRTSDKKLSLLIATELGA